MSLALIAKPCSEACPRIYLPLCGNDGKTYGNECELNVAKCKSKGEIRLKKEGECGKHSHTINIFLKISIKEQSFGTYVKFKAIRHTSRVLHTAIKWAQTLSVKTMLLLIFVLQVLPFFCDSVFYMDVQIIYNCSLFLFFLLSFVIVV